MTVVAAALTCQYIFFLFFFFFKSNWVTIELLSKMKCFPPPPKEQKYSCGLEKYNQNNESFHITRAYHVQVLHLRVAEVSLPVWILMTYPLARFFSPSADLPINFSPSLLIKLTQKWNMKLEASLGTSAATVYKTDVNLKAVCCVTLSRLRLPLRRKAPASTLHQLFHNF